MEVQGGSTVVCEACMELSMSVSLVGTWKGRGGSNGWSGAKEDRIISTDYKFGKYLGV